METDREKGKKVVDKDLKNSLIYIPKYFKVLSKAMDGQMPDLVPMVLWPSQKYYVEHRTNRDIILKSRQTGMSTGIMADNAHKLFTIPYQRASIITHDQETSEFLFQTVQRFYHNLPANMRPETDWKSGSRMRFPKMDSYIYIDSAKSDSLGIGHTLNIAHLSEVAKWPYRKAEALFADVSQTVSEGGFITVESTPRGRGGIFYNLYDAGKKGDINYKTFFFPWWWDVTCRRTTENLKYTKDEQELINYVRKRDNIELSKEQIAFRREKFAELKDLFFQEYPESDVDCWLSSEISVFDGIAIRNYLQQIYPGKVEGNFTIWKDVIGGEKYVIGVDVAAGKLKGDYSVAAVLNVKRNEYVACLRGRIPPDLFAQDLLRLGQRYNMAQIGVERTGHGFLVLRTLLENSYPDIYYHLDFDSAMQLPSSEPGWKTSIKTKPIMIGDLASQLRSNSLGLWSENFLIEASAMTWEGQESIRTPSGGHDDEVDAVMIALQLRGQAPIMEERRYRPESYVKV